MVIAWRKQESNTRQMIRTSTTIVMWYLHFMCIEVSVVDVSGLYGKLMILSYIVLLLLLLVEIEVRA